MIRITVIAALFAASFTAAAEDRRFDEAFNNSLSGQPTCQAGSALTYSMQCDPGSRRMEPEEAYKIVPGAAICRAIPRGCMPIIGIVSPAARREHQVRDAAYSGELVSVTFGLAQLLDQGD